jgi:4-hydroxy-2-oxoheptanedioate aldolase
LLQQKLAAGTIVKGSFIMTGTPAFVEMLGLAGFDFVVIDTEHSPNDPAMVEHLVRAAEVGGLAPIVRVTENEPSLILRALDVAAAGILVPQVNSAAAAAAAVRAAKYPPQGERGVAGIVRAARYGFMPVAEYVAAANANTMVIAQIEDLAAVRDLEAILAVPGLDGIFIGPTDLSLSMGMIGQFDHPQFRQVVQTVIDQGLKAQKWVGIFCLNAADARYWQDQGVQLLAIGTDTSLYARAVRALAAELP